MSAQTYTSKSQKFNQMVAGNETLGTVKNNRWFKVWFDMEAQEWQLQAGREMMPADYTETHTDIAELEKSMREVATFRSWNFSDWA